jgi:hypothetical protein
MELEMKSNIVFIVNSLTLMTLVLTTAKTH